MSVAIVQQQVAGATLGAASTHNVTTPALTTTPTVGNVLVVSVLAGASYISSSLVNNTSGWTQITNDAANTTGQYDEVALFVKVCASGDTGAISLTWTSSYSIYWGYSIRVMELSGASISGITYVKGAQSGSTSVAFSSISPPNVGSLGFIDGVDDSNSWPTSSLPSGITYDDVYSQTSSSETLTYGYYHTTSAASSTSPVTYTFSSGTAGFLAADAVCYYIPAASSATPQSGYATSALTAKPTFVLKATFKATSTLTAKPTLAARTVRFASSIVSALASASAAPVAYGLGSAVVTAASSVTVALATAPAIGDILTVVIGAYDPTAISFTPPSGWTMIQHYTSGSGFSESAYFQRTATSADVTTHSYTFGLASSSSAARAVIFGVTGAIDATVSSIVGTVTAGSAPIVGSGNAETAGTNELLVVFATSTRASELTAAPSISPTLTSIGSIPFATDGSVTPTVAGWTSTASFTTPTVTIDTSNNPNASLVGVMTMGFTASSVAMRTFAATVAASAKMLSLAKAAIASVSSAGAKPKLIAAWSQKQTSAASAKSLPIAKTATKATSAATAKPKNLASATLKQTSTASAKAIPIGKTATKATSAASARIGSVARSVTRAMSTASAVPRLLAAFASSGSSAASAAAKVVANLTARATSVLTATGSWFIPGGTTYYHTGTASSALGAVQHIAMTAVWRASSVTSAVSSLVGRSLGRASSTASARSTGRASSTVSAAAAASARALAAVAIREASSTTASPKASAIARTAAKATATVSARLGVFAILLGRALVLVSGTPTLRAFFTAVRSSVVTASGSWYALGGNVARTFTATSNAIAVGTNRMSLAFKATSAASARFAPIARPTAKAISAAIGAIRLSSASIAKATSTISPRVGIAAITRGAAAAVASARATLLVQSRLAAVSNGIGHIGAFLVRAPIAAISLLQAHGNWYATSGVTLRTFAASSVASAREAIAASSVIRATSVAVALERAKTLAGYLAASTVSARSASMSLVRRSANVGVSAKAALVNVRTFVAAVATSARIRFGAYSVAGASSTLTGVNRGRIVAILRGTVAAGARFAPVVRIVRGAIAAVSALARAIFTGRTITVALPNGDGETIIAPLEIGCTIQAPLERGLTITAPIETLATILAPLERGLTIFAPLQIGITIDA